MMLALPRAVWGRRSLFATCAWCIVAAGCGGEDAVVHAAARPGAATSSARVARPAQELTPSMPGIDCLTDDVGIRRKVLVHREGAMLAPGPGVADAGRAASLFRPYFLFDVHPSSGPAQWFEVGTTPRRASVVGWVHAGSAVEWSTRVGARRKVSRSGRAVPLLVYEHLDDLVELVERGGTDAEPIARAAGAGRSQRHAWPIAEIHRQEIGGQQVEFHRLQFLGKFSGEAPPANASGPNEHVAARTVVDAVRQIDLMFVVDATGSMEPFIDAAKRTVQRVADEVRGMGFQPDLAYGFCAYRDHNEDSGFVTRHLDLTKDERPFLSFLRDLDVAGGANGPEAAYDGVQRALCDTSWRGAGLSHRILVLIGDEPAAEPGHRKNPANISAEDLTELANEFNVHIFGLGVGGLDNQDYCKRRAQFCHLGEATAGGYFGIEDADNVVSQVERVVLEGSQTVAKRSQVVESQVRGTLDADVADGRIQEEDVAEVMEFLRDHGGLDLKALGGGAAAYGTGWVLASIDGSPSTEKVVWIARAEMDFLMAQLQDVAASLAPDTAGALFDIARNSRTGSFMNDTRPATMRAWLQARGVPCHGASILNFTASGLLHSSETERAKLRERISRVVMPDLLIARNSDRFRTIDGIDWGWIPESLLP